MKALVVVNRSRDSVLAAQARVADRWWSRARGLIGRPPLPSGEGMLLSPCRAVHMLGMRYALDVLFLDRRGCVLALYPGLEPGQRSPWHRRARYALEVPPGTIDASRTTIGDLIAWLPADGNGAGSRVEAAGDEMNGGNVGVSHEVRDLLAWFARETDAVPPKSPDSSGSGSRIARISRG